MDTKDFTAKVKAAGPEDGLDEGQFDAIVSVFGNEDSMGDVVVPGAFKDDIGRWEKSGDPLPVIWAHDWSDPFSHIGHVVKAEETDAGLKVRGQLDMDNPKAQQVYRLLKGRRVTQFSFAYDVEESGWSEKKAGDDSVFELRKLKVHEVGPCLLGANQETDLLAVKAQGLAAGVKAGRVLSQKNYDLLAAARDSLSSVLESASEEPKTSAPSGAEKTDEPSQADGPVTNGEEPQGAKLEESPVKSAPRRALAVARITNLS